MSLLVLGLDHRTAPVELRERLAIERAQLPHALAQLAADHAVPQAVILSTCNRTEIYACDAGDSGDAGGDDRDAHALANRLAAFLARWSAVPDADLAAHLYRHRETDCVAHLFRLAAGLESMIVGERQILGQTRAAFCAASQGGYVKSPLTRVFHHALRTGRRVHRETAIGQNSRSVSRAAVHLARTLFDRLDDRRALVIGAGDAGRMVARALADAGVRQITVTNRTQWRADDLARQLGGIAVPFDHLPDALADADLVISSTGSPGYVLTLPTAAAALARRAAPEPALFIDIAVPRDIDPAVAGLPGARLFDIDALAQVSEIDLAGRSSEIARARDIVADELARFSEWWHSSDTMALVAAMRRRADALRRAEVARTLHLLHADPDSELARRLDAMTNALVKKLLHQPTAALRAGAGSSAASYEAARRLFISDDDTDADADADDSRNRNRRRRSRPNARP